MTPSKYAAYADQRIEPMLAQTGLMGCYCFDQIVKTGKVLDDTIKNQLFSDINAKDDNKYCAIWLEQFLIGNAV